MSNSAIAYNWQVESDGNTPLLKNTLTVLVTIIPLLLAQVEYSSLLLSDYWDYTSLYSTYFRQEGQVCSLHEIAILVCFQKYKWNYFIPVLRQEDSWRKHEVQVISLSQKTNYFCSTLAPANIYSVCIVLCLFRWAFQLPSVPLDCRRQSFVFFYFLLLCLGHTSLSYSCKGSLLCFLKPSLIWRE